MFKSMSTTEAAVGFLLLILITSLFVHRRKGALPPGPKGWPILGNALDWPSEYQWLTLAKWSDKWGDLISLNLLGQRVVVINSLEHAINLFDKRSTIYSDRPILTMGGTLVGWNKTLVLLPYGNTFREVRRNFRQIIGTPHHVAKFSGLVEVETLRLLQNLAKQPDKFMDHVRLSVGATIIKMAYGYQVKGNNDPLAHIVDVANEEFALATIPGAWIVDIFPLLRFVPSWFPGAGWKKTAATWAKDFNQMWNVPYNSVKKQIAAGTAVDCFTSMLLEGDITEEQEHVIKISVASLYSGGADTTVSAICSFFLAMTCYPEVQRKAQLELDSVTGSDRLPTYADRENLPYINAICMEIFRWNPVAPFGGSRCLGEDNAYEGYVFPKGTVLFVNNWKLLHDPRVYANPMEFAPERFISKHGRNAEKDPREISFGFGRRVCPGMHLANQTLFMAVVMTLATFNITKAVEDGKVIEPSVKYSSGTVSHPMPFKCSIKPRSLKAETLIHSMNDLNFK